MQTITYLYDGMDIVQERIGTDGFNCGWGIGLLESRTVQRLLSKEFDPFPMKIYRLIILMILMLAVACRARSTSEGVLIPKEQLKELQIKAEEGDLKSVKRLIEHYEVASQDSAVAERWRAKARSLGDAEELYFYAARLLTEATAKTDQVKKRELLAEALEAAECSRKIRLEKSTLRLIDQIKRESSGKDERAR